MAHEQTLARYRRCYRALLRFYPRSHRVRFAQSMEQTFGDLCHERVAAGAGLFALVLWIFIETSVCITRERVRQIMTQAAILRVAIGTACILLVPLLGNLCWGWHWPPTAFVAWGGFVFVVGLTYELVASRGGTLAYRVAVGLACTTGFVLLFISAAAGIIGDGAVNVLYFGVVAVPFFGTAAVRCRPRGMALVLVGAAVAQMLVPVIALLLWRAGRLDLLLHPDSPHPPFHPGVGPVFVLSAVFALAWIVSALLFWRAGASGIKRGGTGAELAADQALV